MEAGTTLRNALENGVDPETAQKMSDEVWRNNVGMLAASNATQFGLLNKILKGSGWKSRLASAGLGAGIQGLEEFNVGLEDEFARFKEQLEQKSLQTASPLFSFYLFPDFPFYFLPH